jgi:hypothetical protein
LDQSTETLKSENPKMSDIITISSGFSTSGGILETGAGLPIVQVYNETVSATGTIVTGSGKKIIIENPLFQSKRSKQA